MTPPEPNPSRRGLAFTVLEDELAICRLPSGSRIPRWAREGRFWSHAGSSDETSIVCAAAGVPEDVRHDGGWRALKIDGPLDFQLIGVLEALVRPLTKAGISLFAISTFDTDYVLIREKNLDQAIRVLEKEGHRCGAGRRTPEPRAEAAPDADETDAGDRGRGRRRRRTRSSGASVAEDRRSDGRAEEAPRSAERSAPETREVDEDEESTPDRHRDRGRSRGRRDDRGGDRPERPEPARSGRPPGRREDPDHSEEDAPERDDDGPDRRDEESPRDRRPSRRRDEEEPAPEEKVAAPVAVEPAPRGRRDGGRRDEADDRADGPRGRRHRGRERAIPEDVTSEGLYAGGIAQAPLETTNESFADLGLSEAIVETITEIGFQHPTPIQVDAIPVALGGRDVIGLAETGSGKTAAFSLPLAEKLTHGEGVRGLILCPTREIALQTKAFLEIFGHDHALETAVVIGGVPMGPQIRHLARQPDIIVATPGRIADHVRRGNVSLRKVERLVLDEADHMLDLGFLPQIMEILETVPDDRQTMMFSATMPPEIQRLASRFMRDPVTIDFRPAGRTAEGIEHRLYLVRREDQKDCLIGLLKEVPGTTLIFVRRKVRTEWMARLLEEAGFTAERIHSDRSQAQRVDALRGFRTGNHRILVATDVAARGIDVPAIRHVINFGAPENVEDYVHRAGRTARGSNDGIVSTVSTPLEKGFVKEIEMEIGQELQRRSVEGVEAWKEIKVKKRIRRRLL